MKGAWRIRQMLRAGGRFLFRLRVVLPHCGRAFGQSMRWLIRSREDTNLTYDLTDLNVSHLVAFVAHLVGISHEQAAVHVRELQEDDELQNHVRRLTIEADMADCADEKARYGRRLGWYALIRARKPAVVIETGIDKGLGSCVICAALRRNAKEGHEGHLYATDINPKAGWLLRAPYSEFGTILLGDSIESLKELDAVVDLFISDSDHSADYELEEYRTVEAKLASDALVLSDNAHCTDALLRFAAQTEREYLYFQEEPANHWYHGGGIGAAFRNTREG